MSNSPLGASTDWRNPERENIPTEFDYEKCDLCTSEAKYYFKKFNEWLCDDCWNAAMQESLIELSYSSMENLIIMHEKAIDLLGMINHYKMVMDRERDNIVWYRNLKEIADKAQHRLVIAQMCENRLRERYKKLMTNEKPY